MCVGIYNLHVPLTFFKVMDTLTFKLQIQQLLGARQVILLLTTIENCYTFLLVPFHIL